MSLTSTNTIRISLDGSTQGNCNIFQLSSGTLNSDYQTCGSMLTTNAIVTNSSISNAVINSITSGSVLTTNLSYVNATASNLNVNNSSISNVVSNSITSGSVLTTNLNYVNATASNLNVSSGTVANLNATSVTCGSILSNNFISNSGSVALSTTPTTLFTTVPFEYGKCIVYIPGGSKLTSFDYNCVSNAIVYNTNTVGSNPIVISVSGANVQGAFASGSASVTFVKTRFN